MSLSAVDHYEAWKARQQLETSQKELQDREDVVVSHRREIAALQAELNEALGDFEDQQMNVQAANEELEVANAIAENHVKPPKTNTVVDPTTGLPQGERIVISQAEIEFVEAIHKARDFMAVGDIDQARVAEKRAMELLRKLDTAVDARALALPDAFQVTAAEFLEPRSNPSKEELEATFAYAREHAELTTHDVMLRKLFMDQVIMMNAVSTSYPQDVSQNIMMEIWMLRSQLEAKHKEDQEERMEVDEEEQPEFEMHNAAWDAIEKAIRNRIELSKSTHEPELNLPRSTSAPIARYNPNSHFLFQSEEANASVDALVDALCCGSLLSRPSDMFQEKCAKVRRPFEIGLLDLKWLDLDGDMIAVCGDLADDYMGSPESYVGYQSVPGTPMNLETTGRLFDLKDKQGNSILSDTEVVFEDSRCKEYFSAVVADSENDRIWASSSKTGTIRGFSTKANLKKKQRKVALLAFDEKEIESQSKWVNGKFNIARCDDVVVGTAGTQHVSVWNMARSAEEYSMVKASRLAGKTAELDESTTDNEHAKKRHKTCAYKGMTPHLLEVELDRFACGDVQWLGGQSQRLLIAPLRSDGPSNQSTSMPLYDLAAEKIVGLFIGNRDSVSIEKQYCAESHNLVFSMDGGTGLVWDLRTFRPTFALHTNKPKGQILGIPSSNPVAFTFNDDSESISCWDLRMPASQSYKMSTGNTHVQSMVWHEASASLFASTRSDHKVTYGRYGSGYMYGERVPFADSDLLEHVRSKHEPNYFGSSTAPWHLGSGDAGRLLRYSFETKN